MFENANRTPFSNQNCALVKYHFCFSECSTRFPCDFFQPTLFRAEITKNSQLWGVEVIARTRQSTLIYSYLSAIYQPKINPPGMMQKSRRKGCFSHFRPFWFVQGFSMQKYTNFRDFSHLYTSLMGGNDHVFMHFSVD